MTAVAAVPSGATTAETNGRPPIALAESTAAFDEHDALKRIERLVDTGSFQSSGSQARHRVATFGMGRSRPPGDGVVTGVARLEGRPIAVYAQDPAALGGSLGELHAAKIVRLMGQAERARMPLVGLIDSGGARIQEGVASLDGYGQIFRRNVLLSGRVPQISVVLGSCAGGAAYSPALTDVVIMTKQRAHMFLTGPSVLKALTGEDVTAHQLGGAGMHGKVSGVAHLVVDDVGKALTAATRVLSYLPASCWHSPPESPSRSSGETPMVPENPRQVYDVRTVVSAICDSGSFMELQPDHARNIVIGFARLDGASVGVVANQPLHLAGTLDSAASEKGARFVRFCDAFGLPLITLVDTPGFLPGVKQEASGVIRKGAKLLYAFAEATVPRVTVVLRKAFGGAYIVMNSKSLGADAVYCWPGAEMAVMGAEGAIDIVFRRELSAEPHRRDELLRSYRQLAMSPSVAAERLSVDEIISPDSTRQVIISALGSFKAGFSPRFRHDNLPQ